MKKLLLFSAMLFILAGCSSKKQIEQELNSGNYDQAVRNALHQLQSKKTEKRKSKFIGILKDAYVRVTERDLEDIAFLKKDNNPQNFVRIHKMYMTLDSRQRAIKPVLPLFIDGQEVTFDFKDYTSDIINTKNRSSDYLYTNAENLLTSTNKYDFRNAFEDLKYLNNINPNYKNTQGLMEIALQKGRDFVLVSLENKTHQIIPNRLEGDLLDFNTYGLDNLWTVYHSIPDTNIDYDYAMQLELKQINISPERINQSQILREKEIVDGWEYQLDLNGNVAQDSLGNDIKVDKIINAKARLFEVNQFKSTRVIAKVVYQDLKTNQLLDTFPIDSEFIFENNYATVRGDRRALNDQDRDLLNNRRVNFPSNEQMVFDTGEDLKHKLKSIITSYNIRG